MNVRGTFAPRPRWSGPRSNGTTRRELTLPRKPQLPSPIMATTMAFPTGLPFDPLKVAAAAFDDAARRRAVLGVLDSYHSTYDIPSEAIQNAIDAVEDASLLGLPGPYRLEVSIDLESNTISFLDTGVGMNFEQVTQAFAPHVSFKSISSAHGKRKARNVPHRGFKGIGMTFLAYSTDDITLHSKKNDVLTQVRMQYGHSWATGARRDSAILVEDQGVSPLVEHDRGTFLRVQFSAKTRPKSLRHVASSVDLWSVILRTRTAIGQVLLTSEESVQPIEIKLTVTKGSTKTERYIEPLFLYPHDVPRIPKFRFLDLIDYYEQNPEQASPPTQSQRQDGLFLRWDTARITEELTADQRSQYAEQLGQYSPTAYAFVPYQASVWGELNRLLTNVSIRRQLSAGLMIAVNRQRLADLFDVSPSRYVTFGKNAFAVVHYQGAKPDHGRKTIDTESTDLAGRIADRMIQYLARQRAFLRTPGEEHGAQQREVETNHEDWKFNVRSHSKTNPLHAPPICYRSTPLTEQDVVGLFHQLGAVGAFAGVQIHATSQSQTYDCLLEYDCPLGTPGLAYEPDASPLGVSPYVLGSLEHFKTHPLTVEFKNNLDGLISDIEGESPKQFSKIDICVCWSAVGDEFSGYALEKITEDTIDMRKYPGCTHVLHRDGNPEVMGVIMLKTVMELIETGRIAIPVN